MTAMGHVWTVPRCKRNLTISEAFGCGHVFGLLSLGGLPLSRCSRYGRWATMRYARTFAPNFCASGNKLRTAGCDLLQFVGDKVATKNAFRKQRG